MSSVIALGVSGVEAQVGDHICGLYSGHAQRDQVVIPFLEAGLTAGDKCICVVDETDPAKIFKKLGHSVETSASATAKQLEVIRAADLYLRSGRFSADEIIGAWKAAISDAMYDGRFDLVRAVETWSRREVVPDMHELLLLESEMNRYLPLYPQVIVCLYDIDRFGAEIIVSLLKTHPRMLIGGMLVENPYYVTPDELLAGAAYDSGTSIAEAAKWYFEETTGSI
ncbi:MAG TPA: MEDS domain-containing protein [Mycobacterium sp.]|nr:MEDS domain-containing protein [Mycobacterium sp.]